MLNTLVEALGKLVMVILIFIGVVVAGVVGALLFAVWSSLQFVVIGAAAIIGLVFAFSEGFQSKK